LALETVNETQLCPNLLKDWHDLKTIADVLVEVSPDSMQPILTNHRR